MRAFKDNLVVLGKKKTGPHELSLTDVAVVNACFQLFIIAQLLFFFTKAQWEVIRACNVVIKASIYLPCWSFRDFDYPRTDAGTRTIFHTNSF